MEIRIVEEAGYESAIMGMSLSFKDRAEPMGDWWRKQREKAERRAALLAQKGGGHNDFLKQIMVWIDIEAPRYWWSEMDTYHFVWKNSESTMHTLKRRDLTLQDFEGELVMQEVLEEYRKWRPTMSINDLKGLLPESYLQRRMCTTNYLSLRNIIAQRHDHRLPQWQIFCDAIRGQVQRPELLEW